MAVVVRASLWLLALLLAAGCAVAAPVPPSSAGGTAGRSGPAAPAGMATIARADLPAEARDTLALIASHGPYPYAQDGAVFENREGLLPDRPRGHYHEYTVVTPGSSDRGARRIIAGNDGELYWTADHYASFAWILP